MTAEVHVYLLLKGAPPRPPSILICRSIAEAREEWFRALEADPETAGLIHCGETHPEFEDIDQFFIRGRILATESARLVFRPPLGDRYTVAGFLSSPTLCRMKIYEMKKGWRSKDLRTSAEADSDRVKPRRANVPSEGADAPAPNSLLSGLDALLQTRTPRQIAALQGRLAIDGVRRTLDQAGQSVSLTRERVRQLESRFVRDVLATEWASRMLAQLRDKLATASEPLELAALSAEPDFAEFATRHDFLRAILPMLSEGHLQVYDFSHSRAICDGRVPPWDDLERLCLDQVAALPPLVTTSHQVMSIVIDTLRAAHCAEFSSAMLSALSDRIHYSAEGCLLGCGDTQGRIVESILRDSERPLHYSEVAERWSARVNEHVDPLTAHRALTKCRAALLLGRGTYGVPDHIGLGEDLVAGIIADCEYIVVNATRARQWHASEIIVVLQDLRPDLSEHIDKYVLSALLQASDVLTPVGRLVWCLKEGAPLQPKRIDMRDAAVEALARLGHPLPDAVLRAEVIKERGVDRAYFVLQATDELIRVAPGVWGLVSRDFGVTGDQRATIQDQLYRTLRIRGSALHSSEVIGSLQASAPLPTTMTGYMVQQLAALDERIKLFYGELLGLTEWGSDARRPTARGAMQHIAASISTAVTLDSIQEELERLIGRKIARAALCSIVSQSELSYDAQEKLWKRDTNLPVVS